MSADVSEPLTTTPPKVARTRSTSAHGPLPPRCVAPVVADSPGQWSAGEDGRRRPRLVRHRDLGYLADPGQRHVEPLAHDRAPHRHSPGGQLYVVRRSVGIADPD